MENNERYEAAIKSIEEKKMRAAANAYAAGASILLFNNQAFHTAAFYSKFFLLVMGLFAAFYMTTQV